MNLPYSKKLGRNQENGVKSNDGKIIKKKRK